MNLFERFSTGVLNRHSLTGRRSWQTRTTDWGSGLTFYVLLGRQRIAIEETVFTALLENSVANHRADYVNALEASAITFDKLVHLARIADIPYVLFFAPTPVVEAQLEKKTDKLLQGLTKSSFSLNSRNEVALRDIELIVKDLLRKQELLKKHDKSLVTNTVVRALSKPGRTIPDDAQKLLDLLELPADAIRSVNKKEDATRKLIEALEAKQILVAQSQNNYMPQLLRGVKFSGITIKDSKVPYIFLAGGDEGENQEPAGRRTFTLVLLTVLISRGIFAPVTYNGRTAAPAENREFAIAAEILMPVLEFRKTQVDTLASAKETADLFKVTPSAAIMRALRLGMTTQDIANAHLRTLDSEYAAREKPQPRPPKAVNAIRRYNGSELSRRMMAVHDSGGISSGEFCRAVCLNKIKPAQIGEFRAAL
ncbi:MULTISPECIES: hypothetical protein [unclassified Frondihabitans]|uniref:hypothetical protein n=1 Tax=unclassified Frondihabitans TaxID=2626248 RepID=UPI000F4E4382|nr:MULTISPECIES: hypothetical protein [unclassified Frondihabitans]RPE73811.1 hypothetical protein EDF37_3359 [Frondihabitans sp. PhB153]RPF04065.1 hypothetical protein EDF39_2484 [Frondihabitans sp. PhB161]